MNLGKLAWITTLAIAVQTGGCSREEHNSEILEENITARVYSGSKRSVYIESTDPRAYVLATGPVDGGFSEIQISAGKNHPIRKYACSQLLEEIYKRATQIEQPQKTQ